MKHFVFTFCLMVLSLSSVAETTRNDNNNSTARERGVPSGVTEQNLCNSELQVMARAEGNPNDVTDSCSMLLKQDFADALKTLVPKCAKEAALANGWNLPTSVTLYQMGGYSNRTINTPTTVNNPEAKKQASMSRHSEGQALDVDGILLHGSGSSPVFIPLTEEAAREPRTNSFYKNFRACWDKELTTDGRVCTCSIGHPHVHEPSNELHRDHMHLSLTCPAKPGVAGC